VSSCWTNAAAGTGGVVSASKDGELTAAFAVTGLLFTSFETVGLPLVGITGKSCEEGRGSVAAAATNAEFRRCARGEAEAWQRPAKPFGKESSGAPNKGTESSKISRAVPSSFVTVFASISQRGVS